MAVERFSKQGIIEAKTALEGGYVNHSDDLGGPTNFGITQATAREYGYKGDMRNLTKEIAYDIYVKLWWNKMRLDDIIKISPTLADRMFDFGINSGRANCIKSLQEILNVLNLKETLYPDIAVDGGIGPGTLEAIRLFLAKRGSEGANILFFTLTCYQVRYYGTISLARKANESFTYGWFARVWRDMRSVVDYYLGKA